MPIPLFQAADIAERANYAYSQLKDSIRSLLPYARIEHVGATAVPGVVTKGHVDVLVLVRVEKFALAEAILANSFVRNTGTEITGLFASFSGELDETDIGVQCSGQLTTTTTATMTATLDDISRVTQLD